MGSISTNGDDRNGEKQVNIHFDGQKGERKGMWQNNNSQFQTKKKRSRCGECIGCQKKDNCGDCAPCNNKGHQICKQRRCEKLTDKKVS